MRQRPLFCCVVFFLRTSSSATRVMWCPICKREPRMAYSMAVLGRCVRQRKWPSFGFSFSTASACFVGNGEQPLSGEYFLSFRASTTPQGTCAEAVLSKLPFVVANRQIIISARTSVIDYERPSYVRVTSDSALPFRVIRLHLFFGGVNENTRRQDERFCGPPSRRHESRGVRVQSVNDDKQRCAEQWTAPRRQLYRRQSGHWMLVPCCVMLMFSSAMPTEIRRFQAGIFLSDVALQGTAAPVFPMYKNRAVFGSV